jgi:hypothetical protein
VWLANVSLCYGAKAWIRDVALYNTGAISLTSICSIKALRYKLRMFGIPIEGATNVLGDNESVVNSASKVEARLNKKHNAICFHTVREASAANWIRVGWEPTASNIADIFTKMLDTEQRRKLLSRIFVKGG